MSIVYAKAIRDKIPEIIYDSGRKCTTKELTDAKFLPVLEHKLEEEVREYREDGSVDELADVLEVVFRIAELRGVDADSLDAIRRDKADRCGRFEKNLFLIDAQETKD